MQKKLPALSCKYTVFLPLTFLPSNDAQAQVMANNIKYSMKNIRKTII